MDEPHPTLRTVELVGLPIVVHRRAADHSATMRREMALVAASSDWSATPARLLELAHELGERYAGFGSESDAVMQDALARGETTVDLRYDVPIDVVDACVELNSILDEVDEYSRAGDLVTLVSPPDVLAYRRWFLDQFITQLRDGAEPTRWSTPSPVAESMFEPARESVEIAVNDDLDLEGAARLRTVIAEHVGSGAEKITLDLAGCVFIDSVGISLLLTTFSRLRRDGGNLILRNIGRQPTNALRTAGVLQLLTT
jgi:anti-anti-sigma factor